VPGGTPGGRRAGSPVVIGGLGGSGTRAVAAVLRHCGLELRGPINRTLDSDWAILLLKHPRWPARLRGADRPLAELTDVYRTLGAMCRGETLSAAQLSILGDAAAACAALGLPGEQPIPSWPPPMPFRLVSEYLANPPAPPETPWGWKQPGSHMMLPELSTAFPELRFVYVVRDPLDMAFSDNRQGLRLWSALIGLQPAEIDAAPEQAQLDWWLHSTRAAVAGGRPLGDRWMLLRTEELCADPPTGTRALAAFAGLDPDESTLAQAAALVSPPASIGRWEEHGIDGFDRAAVEEARAWITQWDGDQAASRS
jgi:Sulfotransferase family